ncbi:MAG: hypothetical protein MI919_21525, partial [Holophagales bacterium]|nr:hypothetical protein [Holophagales bacterium]
MTRQLRLLRFEWAMQMRTVRFRVAVALYLIVASAPPFVELLFYRPISTHILGSAAFFVPGMQAQRFATVILALVVAGNRSSLEGWRQLWVVLSAAPASSAEILVRRWIS